MPEFDDSPFIPQDNISVLNAIRNDSDMSYQDRVPEATKSNIDRVVANLLDYTPTRNEFLDNLVNFIGLQIVKSQVWSNPLAPFKRGLLRYGDSIEEIQVGLIKARVYNPDREVLERELFGVHKPNVQANFHRINRQDKYVVSVNDLELRRAFDSEFGLSNLITGIMSAPTTSDNVDEYKIMTHLFTEYEQNGGFFKNHVSELASDDSTADDAKLFLKRVRSFSGKLQFVDTKYNAARMPVFANPSDLVLFTTPDVNAALDVDALSAAFQIDRANVASRIVLINDEDFGIPGAQAVLTTNDFFMCADTYMNTTSQFNPGDIHTNYWLHHHGIYSVSRFAPAILFTTDAGTVINLVDTPATAIAAPTLTEAYTGDDATEVNRGSLYQADAVVTTNPANGSNTAVVWGLTGNQSRLTYVTPFGVLHVSIDEPSDSLVLTARAEDNNELTSEATFNVVGPQAVEWPNPHVNEDSDDDGLFEVMPEAPDFTDNVITIPSVTGVQYKNGAANVANGSQITVVEGTPVTITAVSRDDTKWEITTGTTTSWTFTYSA